MRLDAAACADIDQKKSDSPHKRSATIRDNIAGVGFSRSVDIERALRS